MSAQATLVYGIPVNPYSLLYSARAWKHSRVGIKYLDGMISGELHQDTSRPGVLPTELLEMIKAHFWESALRFSSCKSWLLFDKLERLSYHPYVCCPGRVAKTWSLNSALFWEEYGDDFEEACDQAETDLQDHFPDGCTSKKCNPCLVYKPFMRAHGMTVAHSSGAEWRLNTCILTTTASVDTSRLTTGHEMQQGIEETAVEVSLADLQTHAASGERLARFVSKYDIAAEMYPGVARAEELEEKEKPDKAGSSGESAGSGVGVQAQREPAFYLVATSWCP